MEKSAPKVSPSRHLNIELSEVAINKVQAKTPSLNRAEPNSNQNSGRPGIRDVTKKLSEELDLQ